MKAIDMKELIVAMKELEEERGIKKDYLIESLEMALVTAYKKNFDSADNVKVVIDRETGETHVYSSKTVVEAAKDSCFEISLSDAQKLSKKYELGDVIDVEIVPKNFGRIAAQTAKQVVVQKIREAERDIIYTEFHVVDVERGLKGNPQVIVSRSHPDFVRRLFEFEIPEIYEGLIEIKNIARDAGSRSKVAVYSTNENIDPVGSCVGQKGVRIQNIINELHGEKIDVIEWNEDPTVFIASALLPAQVLAVDVKDEEKFAQVIVPDDQLSLAIGKSGQNARLSAKLTNWKIDIKSESQFRKMLEESQKIPSEETDEVEETESTDENA